MKRFSRLFAAMLCVGMALSLTSCLSSDDNEGIDPTLYKSWLVYITGSYYGDDSSYKTENKIYFINDTISKANKTDSITGVDIRITGDSVIYVNNVPGRLLVKNVMNNDALKKAVENAASKTVKAKFVFYQISNPLAYYFVYPYEVEYKGLNYNGGTHDVKINFYGPTGGAYQYGTGTQLLSFTFMVGDVYEDGVKMESIYDNYSSDERQYRSRLDVWATR